jgi:hypothetical protein
MTLLLIGLSIVWVGVVVSDLATTPPAVLAIMIGLAFFLPVLRK